MAINFTTSSAYIGTSQAVTFPSDPSASTRKITAKIGSYTHTASIAPSATTYTIPVPATVINQISGAVSAKLTVTVTGTTTQTANKTLYVPVTTIGSVNNTTFGGSENVSFTPQATSLKYGVRYIFGPYSVWSQGNSYIEPGSTNSYTDTGTIPQTWANYLFDADSTDVTVELVTYTSANKEVGRVTRTIKVSVPAYTPSFSKTITEGTASGFGVYVQSLSTVRAVVTGFSSSYNSQGSVTAVRVAMTVDGQTYVKNGDWTSSDSVTINSNKLKTYGTKAVTITVTDSRGRTATQTQNITVYQYWIPAITNITTEVSGLDVTVNITGSIAPVNNLNTKLLTVIRKNTKTAVETAIVTDYPLTDYEFAYSFTETVQDVDVISFEYIVTVTDSVTSSTLSKSTGVICISRLAGGLGVCFFQEASEEGVWIRDVDYTISDAEFIALATELAEAYNTATSYEIGDYCLRSSTLYRCKTATTGTWRAANWEAII